MQDKMLKLKDVAEIMGCSYGKIYALARSQALPFKQYGSTWLISKSVLYRELELAADFGEADENL